MNNTKIIISRTDNIGDVLLTLPITGVIRENLSNAQIVFLASKYTIPVIRRCKNIDEHYAWEDLRGNIEQFHNINANTIIHVYPKKEIAELAKSSGIKDRIGTSHRLYHWWTCNKLVHLGRKRSNLHEAQLNLKLLAPLGLQIEYALEELPRHSGWERVNEIPHQHYSYLATDKFNLIIHIMSRGNAKQWLFSNYYQLIKLLSRERFNILITGNSEESKILLAKLPEIFSLQHVTNVMGKFSLDEFITFIQCCDGLLAGSTGPLHIAALSGKHALGLYPSRRPMHALRWAPLGDKAEYISETEDRGEFLNIPISLVHERILKWLRN